MRGSSRCCWIWLELGCCYTSDTQNLKQQEELARSKTMERPAVNLCRRPSSIPNGDVVGGISSQSVEFLQKLDALRKRRMEDRYGVAHTRPSALLPLPADGYRDPLREGWV